MAFKCIYCSAINAVVSQRISFVNNAITVLNAYFLMSNLLFFLE